MRRKIEKLKSGEIKSLEEVLVTQEEICQVTVSWGIQTGDQRPNHVEAGTASSQRRKLRKLQPLYAPCLTKCTQIHFYAKIRTG